MIASAIREAYVTRDGKIVATLRFGKPPEIPPGEYAEEIRGLLAQPRFVRRPDTAQMAWYPSKMPTDSPEWWLAHASDALWPKFDLSLAGR